MTSDKRIAAAVQKLKTAERLSREAREEIKRALLSVKRQQQPRPAVGEDR